MEGIIQFGFNCHVIASTILPSHSWGSRLLLGRCTWMSFISEPRRPTATRKLFRQTPRQKGSSISNVAKWSPEFTSNIRRKLPTFSLEQTINTRFVINLRSTIPPCSGNLSCSFPEVALKISTISEVHRTMRSPLGENKPAGGQPSSSI